MAGRAVTFDEAFTLLIGHEGGYVNNPRDPGGETKFGISKRSYPGEDIKRLTLDRAKAIYLSDFWIKAGCHRVELPDDMRFDLFDMAVNSGAKQAIKTLQRSVGVPESNVDGLWGKQTTSYLTRLPTWRLCVRFNAARLDFMTSLPNWPDASKGWSRRIAANLMRL